MHEVAMARMRAPERLTRSETGELDLARAHLATLVEAAGVLVLAAGHDPDRVECAQAGCRLHGVPDGPEWCRLAHRLRMLDHGGVRPAPARRADLDTALTEFGAALVGSLDAVRACRSFGHAEGRCWFAATTGTSDCGEVLRAAHRVG
jgi:hypothetical protein